MIQKTNILMSIPSRFVFLHSVQSLIQQQTHFSLIFLDIIRFADINRCFGYSVGDQVLEQVASKLSDLLTDDCYLGRISGDVFAIVVKGDKSPQQVRNYTKVVNQGFGSPVTVDNHYFAIDFNMGAVRYPNNGKDFEHLFALLELTLMQAKQNRYEKVAIAEGIPHNLGDSKALALQSDLKRAFNNDELELYLQPKVSLQANYKITGAECLLRWNHPIDGVLIPGPLIEAAESYNMMEQLGTWILQEGFITALKLKAAGCNICLAINISPTQLYDNELIGNIQQFAKQTAIPLSDIELELTENIILFNSILITERLHQLKSLGLKIAIDDFGTGYSNLAYIRDMPIDTIKVDKIFVDDICTNKVNQAIIQGIVTIAQALDCHVVAEGIENHQQAQQLKQLGVDTGQGYLFNRPLQLNDFINQSSQSDNQQRSA